MGKQDTNPAWLYHVATKHSYSSVRNGTHVLDWENQPVPFKIYRDVEPVNLPDDLAVSRLSTLDAISSPPPSGDEDQIPDLATLAHILYFSAGITKKKSYPGGEILFRAAACTGALYHIELYVVCGNLPGLEAGLYHFAPYDFALRKLRSGDWRSVVVEANGGEASLANAPAVLVFTSTFWRNAWKYRARAYRHAFWDGGTILAHLLAAAAARKVLANLVVGFADDPVNRLLDIDPDREAALGLIALGRSRSPIPSAPGPTEPLRLDIAPLSRSEIDYPAIREMHRASSLATGAEARTWREIQISTPRVEPPGALLPLAPLEESETPQEPLEEVVRRRGSTRQFARSAISFRHLSTILQRATQGIPSDALQPYGMSLNDLYLIAHAVEGLPAGAYFHHRDRRALEQLKQGDYRREAGHLDLDQELAADASVNLYMMCRLEPVLARLGPRGYRLAQLEGGLLGGRIYLASYALRLGATGLTFYDDDVTQFFSPHASGKSVMFLMAVGVPARRRVLYER